MDQLDQSILNNLLQFILKNLLQCCLILSTELLSTTIVHGCLRSTVLLLYIKCQSLYILVSYLLKEDHVTVTKLSGGDKPEVMHVSLKMRSLTLDRRCFHRLCLGKHHRSRGSRNILFPSRRVKCQFTDCWQPSTIASLFHQLSSAFFPTTLWELLFFVKIAQLLVE